jgi:hypothetical protein
VQIVPGKDNAVAIELISTHIERQLERRSRRFRQKMAAASLTRSLSRGPPQKLSEEELGLTILEQTPQLKVAIHLDQSEPVFSWHRVSTRYCAIGHRPDKISSSLRIV